ncbi:DNA-binding protein [Methylobacterium sp. 10]|uniref:DNA-binding protein n=1 Tax=Methylobacterium sp. 10 TaxID=1101191 RepID=UPI00047FD668|nr:DNA-binding protein [Methylobacterium sp. 10]
MIGRQTERIVGAASAVLVLVGAARAEAVRSMVPECRSGPTRQEALAGLGVRGELVLASGDRAVLDGIRWPAEDDGEARAWMLNHRDRALTLVPRGEIDRWGRVHVDAAVSGEAIDLAGGLIEAGLAYADAGERDTLCRPALLTLESGARSATRGLWQAGVRDGRDGAALREATGHFIVAQGRVVNVGERPARTYLDFARRGEDGLTVTVSKRTWRRLRERGLSAATLRGRIVRVRGIVEAWRGPTLDIASADMIEVLDEERTLRR